MVMTSLFGKYKSLKNIFLSFPFVVCCASEEILFYREGGPGHDVAFLYLAVVQRESEV